METNILVLRDGYDVEDVPCALPSGRGPALTVDRTSWKTFLQFCRAPVNNISLDERLLYMLVTNMDKHKELSLEQFNSKSLEDILKMLDQVELGSNWRRPTPKQAKMRDLKINDDNTLVIITESESSDSDSSSGVGYGTIESRSSAGSSPSYMALSSPSYGRTRSSQSSGGSPAARSGTGDRRLN